MYRIIGFIFSFYFLSNLIYCQEYKFEHIDHKKGLSHSFIYSIDQDENGLLVVGTGEGVYVFDGNYFQTFTKENTDNRLAQNFISTSFKDSKGNIWLGHKNGGSSLYANKTFNVVHPGDGINSIVNSIAEDTSGRIWFATQNKGLYSVNKDGTFEFFLDDFSDIMSYSLLISKEGSFFIGSNKGLEVYSYYNEENIISKVQEISNISNFSVIDMIELSDGKILIATRQSGLYILNKENNVYLAKRLNIKNYPSHLVIRDVYIHKNNLYVSSFQHGVLKINFKDQYKVDKKYNESSGLKTNAVNTSFVDREGVFWVGTYGAGIASKTNNYFTFYLRDKLDPITYKYLYVTEDLVFSSSGSTLFMHDKNDFNLIKKYGIEEGLPDNNIICFEFSKDSTLFVGTEEKGLFYKKRQQNKFTKINLSDDGLSNSVTTMCSFKNKLWVGTLNGVFKIDEESFGITSYNISTGLTHNAVGYIYHNNNEVYVGTKSSFLTKFIEDDIVNIQLSDELSLVNINMITNDESGNIWVCTEGNGIFNVLKDTVIQYTVSQGLFSNYCYGLMIDNKNNLWITHNGGLTKYNVETNEFKKYNEKYGLNGSFSKAAISRWENELWFGTDNGIIRYDANQEIINSISPITSIRSVHVNDTSYGFNEQIVLPYGEYELEVFFEGLSLVNSKEVTYEYFLEGYDLKWSGRTTLNKVKYTKLSDGEYVFKIKSYNSDLVAGNQVEFKIFIKSPFWKKWWFYIVIFIFLIVIITIVIKLRERNLIRHQRILEKQLALRTKEVVSQKEKIEEINKDLTDSINYAKRIQIQLLPEKDNFTSILPSSFVLYKPKDIVSGDFYWIREIGDDVILICADCTGHGVPGGFMSMIGSILIHEAIVFHKKTDPSDILREIDLNIKTVLHQKDDYESNKDGMDLGIVNFNKKTGLLRFSGAIRPCYIFSENKSHVLQGDRFSIGGFAIHNKNFVTKEFQLKKGDYVYMFSDGFPDQFGGEKNRKLKMSGFNDLLNKISAFPMKGQYKMFNEFLVKWKGESSQMDDILLIGFEYLD